MHLRARRNSQPRDIRGHFVIHRTGRKDQYKCNYCKEGLEKTSLSCLTKHLTTFCNRCPSNIRHKFRPTRKISASSNTRLSKKKVRAVEPKPEPKTEENPMSENQVAPKRKVGRPRKSAEASKPLNRSRKKRFRKRVKKEKDAKKPVKSNDKGPNQRKRGRPSKKDTNTILYTKGTYIKCSVPLCQSYFEVGNPKYLGFSHFPFPEDPVLRKAWINVIGCEDNWDPGESMVCFSHFEKSAFVSPFAIYSLVNGLVLPQRCLKSNAIPSINLGRESAVEQPKDGEKSVNSENHQSANEKPSVKTVSVGTKQVISGYLGNGSISQNDKKEEDPSVVQLECSIDPEQVLQITYSDDEDEANFEEDDSLFFNSLLPHLKSLCPADRLEFRSAVTNVLSRILLRNK